MWVMSSRLRRRRGSRRDRWASGVTVGPGTPAGGAPVTSAPLRLVGGADLVEGDQQVGAAQRPAAYVLQLSYWVWSTTKWPRRNGEITNAGSRVSGPLECSALVGIGVGGPGVDPFGQSVLGSEPVEQREELPALGGLEAATELLLVLNGDLHDFAEQPPALLCEVQGPHATIAGAGLSPEQAALLEGVDQGHHPAGRDLQCVAQRLLGSAFIAGQAAEHHDLARVKAKGGQPRLPLSRRVVAELGEQEGDPGDTQLLGWWGGDLASGHDATVAPRNHS
jgi:hypothetical protein